MTTDKMTNKKAIDYVLTTYGDSIPEDVKEKLVNMRTSLDKKSANRKASATSEENKALGEKVVAILTGSEPKTISEILAADEDFRGLSNQKMTAVVRGLIAEGTVTKTKDGKKSVFALADGE